MDFSLQTGQDSNAGGGILYDSAIVQTMQTPTVSLVDKVKVVPSRQHWSTASPMTESVLGFSAYCGTNDVSDRSLI